MNVLKEKYKDSLQGFDFNSTSTSLFRGSTFYQNWNNFHDILYNTLYNQEVSKTILGVKVPGTTPY